MVENIFLVILLFLEYSFKLYLPITYSEILCLSKIKMNRFIFHYTKSFNLIENVYFYRLNSRLFCFWNVNKIQLFMCSQAINIMDCDW